MFAQSFTLESLALNLLKERDTGIITQVRKNNENLLRKLIAMGIMPGLQITLEQRFPSYVIKVGGMRIAIDHTLARAIYVRRTR